MKILYACDGSDHGLVVEALLQRVSVWRESEITVCSVVQRPMLATGLGLPGEPLFTAELEDAWEDAARRAHTAVEAAERRLKAAGVQVTTEVRTGSPADTLLDFAKSHSFDLIALGSHGESSLEGFLLGSVARRLISYSPVSVLVGRAGPEGPQATADGILAREKLKVLAGVDGSKGSEACLRSLAAMGARAFASAIAASVSPLSPLPADLDPIVFAELYEHDQNLAAKTAAEGMEQLRSCADETFAMTGFGRPSETLCRLATEQSADLIAVAATRHGVIERFLLGSVSNETATKAPCSVMIVRI